MEFVLPTLQASVVCEDVRQENNGIQSLVGVLSIIPAATVPVNLLKLAIWTRWANGTGKFKQTARILAPDNTTVLASASVDFEMQNIQVPHSNSNIIVGVQFTEFGIYHVEIGLNDNVVIRYPLVVAQFQQPASAPLTSA
jgi:hypothetical protein